MHTLAAVNGRHPHRPASLQEAIELILGPFTIVDLSFPFSKFASNSAFEGIQLLQLPRPAHECTFLRRFRQAGGHFPITEIDFSKADSIWPPPPIEANDRAIIIGCNTLSDAIFASDLFLDTRSALITPVISSEIETSLKNITKTFSHRVVRLTDRNGGPSYILFVRRDPTKATRADKRRHPSALIEKDEVLFESAERNVVIDARSVIHDGGYSSEGDLKYSWLWTGPSPHFRIMVPQCSGIRPRQIELCIPRSEEQSNFDLLEIQLDGRMASHKVERWSENSGKVAFNVPFGTDYTVLTLVVPKLKHDSNSGRLLGLCLDKIVLSP